ncbi:unnamed protein product [Cuscuta campestris]|uniref:PRA1 family protein n=1 Tax=Cuscuta campestris TaxID=132261 RepID=A0A484MT19_9ASTE|nr:unnamed protein product [Cuscuta campestris]
MATPTPTVTPRQSTPTAAVASSGGGTVFVPTPAFRNFVNQITDNVRNGLSHRRPWPELVARSAISKPDSFSDATLRIRKNYAYFRTNYHILAAAVIGISLLSNPFTLFLLAGLLAGWLFLYVFRPADQPLVLFGRQFSDIEILAGLVVSTLFVVFLTSVGSVLVSGLFVSVAVVCVHAAFRVPEDFYFDEQAPAGGGIISMLTGSAATAAAAAPSSAATRV